MKQTSIPSKMHVVHLNSYTPGQFDVSVVERPTPTPGSGQVLVRLLAAPINPADLLFMQGYYGFQKPLPSIPGFEGVGVIVAAGGGIMGRLRLGERVVVSSQRDGDGTWQEYMVTPAMRVLSVPKAMSDEQAAMMLINPLTVLGLFERAQKLGTTSIVQTAAAGALGRMLIRFGQTHSIDLINIVRRTEQVDELKAFGAKYVLNSSDPDFDAQLRDLCQRLDARVAFDAISGEMPGRLLAAMPNGSTVIVYGGLAGQPAQIGTTALIFQRKQVEGFWLSNWIASKNVFALLRAWRHAYRTLTRDLPTVVRACYPLTDIHNALADYSAQMSGGKVLLLPSTIG